MFKVINNLFKMTMFFLPRFRAELYAKSLHSLVSPSHTTCIVSDHTSPWCSMKPIRSVLVTGGTGTFGRAFVRHLISQSDISRICIYSRGEHIQAAMRKELGDDSRLRWFIGDVRDKERLTRAMIGVDTVVHAAALKRIETGAYCPDEMVKTNVLGTMNVIDAAVANKVSRVVFISSDKAYQPVSPYGQSKALAESLVLAANNTHGSAGPRLAVVRYGNVWGAQGSVVPYWRQLRDEGVKAAPVTDLECTRFFMTIDEAVYLVDDTLNIMRGGELVIPDWLPAYRVGDLAAAMGFVAVVPSGLPEWEKLHESMREGLCSEFARRMTIDELREKLKDG